MHQIIERWSKKSLSQIFFILAGIILVVVCINYYTAIEIKWGFFNIVSVDYVDLKKEPIIWILFILLLFQYVVFKIMEYLLGKFCPTDSEDYKRLYDNALIFIYTIQDILDLIASIFALGIMIINYHIYDDYGIFVQSIWDAFAYMCIALKFCCLVYSHFQLQNQDIIHRCQSNKNSQNDMDNS